MTSVYDRLADAKTGTSRPQRDKRATKHGEAILELRGGSSSNVHKHPVDHTTPQLQDLFEMFAYKGGGMAHSRAGGRKNSLHDGRSLMDAELFRRFAGTCGIISSKVSEQDVRLIFERTKLRNKTEIDFRGFQRAFQDLCRLKKVPYQELTRSALLQLELMKGSSQQPTQQQMQQQQKQQQAQHQQPQQRTANVTINKSMDTNSILQLVFQHYAIGVFSDSLDKTNWMAFCNECGLFVGKFRQGDAEVIFNQIRPNGMSRIFFNNFVQACIAIAVQLYGHDPVAAFASFLGTHVFQLPLVVEATKPAQVKREVRRISMLPFGLAALQEEGGEGDGGSGSSIAEGDKEEEEDSEDSDEADLSTTFKDLKKWVHGKGEHAVPEEGQGQYQYQYQPPAEMLANPLPRPTRAAPARPTRKMSAVQMARQSQQAYEQGGSGLGTGLDQSVYRPGPGVPMAMYATAPPQAPAATAASHHTAAHAHAHAARAPAPVTRNRGVSYLDEYAGEYEDIQLHGTTKVATANSVYESLSSTQTFTGVYRRNHETPGAGINAFTDAGLVAKNGRPQTRFNGLTNSGTDEKFNDISDFLTKR